MLGILLRIVSQILCPLTVCLLVARTLRGSSDRINISLLAFDAAMCLRRRAEDAEAAEVEVEEVRRGVDAAQGTIEFEVVALVFLDKSA